MREKLPNPSLLGKISVEEALSTRRSVREFKDKNITTEQLSQLLWSAYGVTDKKNNFKTTPSAGATYPLEIYFVKNDGIYYYYSEEHSIEVIKKGDFRKQLSLACLNQSFILSASLSIIICAVFERTTLYYGQRGYRYVYIEVGHSAQNICLQAKSLGLDSVCIGAFDDEMIKKLLSLPQDVQPLYVVVVGEKNK